MADVSEYVRSNNSFSGVDMKASFGSKVIGELQAISYSITREKAPVFTMGSADARAFARGKRGIAGTLIFIMFDRHALLTELRGLWFQADKDDIRPDFQARQSGALASINIASVGGTRTASSPIGGGVAPAPAFETGTQQESGLANFIFDDQEAAHPWYADQIPGFDITLTAANEAGALAVMKIFGCEILNEGYGISIDDIVSEQQMTYIARTIMPWKWVRQPDIRLLRGGSASP
jgi:hypothetical protein